ncbi:MAG: hypothetical protein GF308_17620 [Candidatus Heimdallarchaeota archaeon]|nr:hypothetical protein [Candidatus Heimdallarchaeota archaeon]
MKVHPKTIFSYFSPKMLFGIFFLEKKALISLYYNLRIAGWDDFPVFPDNHAANASFLYFLFKVFQIIKPKRILELGSGQSTNFTSRYLQENEEAKALILENNEDWYQQFKPKLIDSPRLRYLFAPLLELKVGRRTCQWYSTDILEKEKTTYDLLIIDGPVGTLNFSRLGIVKYLPKVIDPADFLIIFDDAQRKGEKDTIKVVKKKLRKKEIPFEQFTIYGLKKQTCISSPDKGFLNTI